MEKSNVAGAIIDEIVASGTKHVFLVPGGACAYLVDAVASNNQIDVVPMLTEGGAGIAAESYGQYKGQLGVVIVTSGPGSTNVLTAVAAAYTDSSPMLVLAGQVKTSDLIGTPQGRQFGFQHLQMDQIVAPITKGFFSLRAEDDVVAVVRNAIRLASLDRPGPVWIEVPLDVQSLDIQSNEEPLADLVKPWDARADEVGKGRLNDFAVDLLEALKTARQPCFLVGNGVRTARSAEELRQLLTRLQVPVLLTWKMIDYLSENDDLLAGRPGGLAPWHANLALQACDLLIVLGSRMDHAQVGYRLDNVAPKAKIFRVEIDPQEARKWQDDRVITYEGDVKDLINTLSANISDVIPAIQNWQEWVLETRALRSMYPTPTQGWWPGDALSMYEVSNVLSESLPENANIVCGSSGQGIEIFLECFKTKSAQRVYCSAALGSMGFGMAGAIGAHYASGGEEVWCIEGDGSASMSLHDLAVVGLKRLPIRLLLLDNDGYMSIRMSQSRLFETRCAFDAETGLPLPDLPTLAVNLGFRILQARDSKELASALADANSSQGPVMIHVKLRREEVSFPRVTTQQSEDGQLHTSNLDDMWPSLEEMKIAAGKAVTCYE